MKKILEKTEETHKGMQVLKERPRMFVCKTCQSRPRRMGSAFCTECANENARNILKDNS